MSYTVFNEKYNKRDMRLEKTSPIDNVDRSGYIPLDLQYARLMSSGRRLEEIKDFEYNVDIEKVRKALSSKDINLDSFFVSHIDKNLSKTDLDILLKEKFDKYNRQLDANKEYKRLLDEYKQLEADKRFREDVINEYKKQLDSKPTI
jgi:hypothetical protein